MAIVLDGKKLSSKSEIVLNALISNEGAGDGEGEGRVALLDRLDGPGGGLADLAGRREAVRRALDDGCGLLAKAKRMCSISMLSRSPSGKVCLT